MRLAFIVAALLILVTAALPGAVQARPPADAAADASAEAGIFLPLLMRHVPGPLNAQVVLDPAHRTRQTVPPAGGTVGLTAANGAKFSLAIPDGALWVTQTITMTVVSALPGLPLAGGAAAMVDFEPDGLQFLQPAVLTIEPAAAIPADRQVFLTYDADGQDVRRHPPLYDRANPARIAMLVPHFSGYGIGSGEGGSLNAYPPSTLQGQIAAQIAALIEAERAAQLAGRPGDPEFMAKLETLHRRMYNEVITPTLNAAYLTGCRGKGGQAAVDKAIGLALSWVRQGQLMFAEETFAAESQAVTTMLNNMLYLCWYDATRPCLDWENPSQVQRVLAISRQAQLVGLPAEQFDPYGVPRCEACEWVKAVRDWEGTVNLSYRNSSARPVYGGTITAQAQASASMRYGMATIAPINGREQWSGPALDGSGVIDDEVVDSSAERTQTWEGSGPLVRSGPYASYAKMNIDPQQCMYQAQFNASVMTTYTNYGVARAPEPWITGTPYLFDLAVPQRAPGRRITGALSLPATHAASSNTHTHFNLGNRGSSAELAAALGTNLGAAQVSWSMAPAWYWGAP